MFDYGCLHHIKQKFWPRYLRNVIKVLKPDGYLLLYTHGIESRFYEKNTPKHGSAEFVVEDVLTHFFKRGDFRKIFGRKFSITSAKVHDHPATSQKCMWTVVMHLK